MHYASIYSINFQLLLIEQKFFIQILQASKITSVLTAYTRFLYKQQKIPAYKYPSACNTQLRILVDLILKKTHSYITCGENDYKSNNLYHYLLIT